MMTDEEISVIIPTLEGDPLTARSVPDSVEMFVVSEGNRAEARNIGAERSSGDILVFCDDDIRFESEFFWRWVNNIEKGTLAGLEDFDFGLLLTRFMVITREDFERLGGFDPSFNHMEDTEFCLNALSSGMDVVSIDRNAVQHEAHPSAGQGQIPTLRNTAILCLRYPRYALRILSGLLQ